MKRLPKASVRILAQPHLHAEAVRIEVGCRYATTGLMREPAPGCVVPAVPALITGAVFVHAQRCGACDTAEAYQQGNAALRDTVERAWRHMQALAIQRRVEGRRN
jgi:hypothetical protein